MNIKSRKKLIGRYRAIEKASSKLMNENKSIVFLEELTSAVKEFIEGPETLKDSDIKSTLAEFGGFGGPKTGYSVNRMVKDIGIYLDCMDKEVAIIGADSFASFFDNSGKTTNVARKFYAKNIFETDNTIIGSSIDGLQIRDIKELAGFLDELEDCSPFFAEPKTNRIVVVLKKGILSDDMIENLRIDNVIDFTILKENNGGAWDSAFSNIDLKDVLPFLKEKKWINNELYKTLNMRDFACALGECEKMEQNKQASHILKEAVNKYIDRNNDYVEKRNSITDETVKYCLEHYKNPENNVNVLEATTAVKYKNSNTLVPDYVLWCALSNFADEKYNALNYQMPEGAHYLISKFDDDSFEQFLFSLFEADSRVEHKVAIIKNNLIIKANCRKYDVGKYYATSKVVCPYGGLDRIKEENLLPEFCKRISGGELNDFIIDKSIWELDRNYNVDEFLFLNSSREALAYLTHDGDYVIKDNIKKYSEINRISVEALENTLEIPSDYYELPKESKIEKGKGVVNNLKRLLTSADYHREYNYFITSDGETIVNTSKQSDIQGAKEFLRAIACNESETEIFISIFDEAVEKGRFRWDKGYEGIQTPTPIAISVAIQLFVDPASKTYCDFVRDKWEFRGDYDGVYTISYIMSTAFPNGWISVYNHDPSEVDCIM